MLRLFILISLFLTTIFFLPASAATVAELQAAVIQAEYQKANDLAKKILSARPSISESQEAQYYLGLSYIRLGEYARAAEAFQKLLAERPTDAAYDRAAVGHVDALYLQGFYDKALKEANGLISRRKSSEMSSLFLLKAARANLKLARWAKAQELLRKIVADYPGSFESDVAQQLLLEKAYFTVQVGSFTDKSRAEKLVEELTQRKEYAFIVENRGKDGKTYYRVRVGQLSTLEDARALEAKLVALGYPSLIYP